MAVSQCRWKRFIQDHSDSRLKSNPCQGFWLVERFKPWLLIGQNVYSKWRRAIRHSSRWKSHPCWDFFNLIVHTNDWVNLPLYRFRIGPCPNIESWFRLDNTWWRGECPFIARELHKWIWSKSLSCGSTSEENLHISDKLLLALESLSRLVHPFTNSLFMSNTHSTI